MASNWKTEIPNLIVLALLIVVLLVVLTKFQWVHCSQIPGWCGIYCDTIMRSHSRVAMIYGEDGTGSAAALENVIREYRPQTYIEPLSADMLSTNALKNYDLIIMEHMRTLSSRQSQAIMNYVNRGGTLVWVGDAASAHYYDPYDLQYAFTQNETFYAELEADLVKRNLNETLNSTYAQSRISAFEKTPYAVILANKDNLTIGFSNMSVVIAARYVKTEPLPKNSNLSIISRDHMLVRGLNPNIAMPVVNFTIVNINPAAPVELIASVKTPDKKTYPAIFETRYAGRIIYFAFPLENLQSITLLTNLLDYLVPC